MFGLNLVLDRFWNKIYDTEYFYCWWNGRWDNCDNLCLTYIITKRKLNELIRLLKAQNTCGVVTIGVSVLDMHLFLVVGLCILFFTALHGMQTRSYDENSVRPSVRLSVCLSVRQMRELWQNGWKICLDFYIIRKNIYPSFLRRRMVGGGNPFYLKFWVNRPALERNRRLWTDNRS